MSNITHIINYMLESKGVIEAIARDEKIQKEISRAAEFMIRALRSGRKILACGNGGSMCDAMHFVSELTGRYKMTRDPFAAVSLSDPAAMSCIANDFDFGYIFRRQVIAIGNLSDVLLAITTSGASRNVINAIIAAKQRGMSVIVLTGANGVNKSENSFENCDVEIKVPSIITNHIQQGHINIIHILVELIEKEF